MGLGTHKVKLESLEKLKDSRRPQDFLCLEVFFACVQQRDGDFFMTLTSLTMRHTENSTTNRLVYIYLCVQIQPIRSSVQL